MNSSAIFTCGKFAFGRSTYDSVLANYLRPMTFAEYIVLSDDDQKPFDEIVKERTVGRLIIKNSLNEQLREYLVHTFSVNNNTCYPNTISDAVSLLSTFAKSTNTTNITPSHEDAVVSYHESEDTVNYDNDSQPNIIECNDIDDIIECNDIENIEHDVNIDKEEAGGSQVTFSATVMAAVIAEAMADVDEKQFIGASFTQM
jgi:hypothetical protein